MFPIPLHVRGMRFYKPCLSYINMVVILDINELMFCGHFRPFQSAESKAVYALKWYPFIVLLAI